MKLALAQFDVARGDPKANLQTIECYARDASGQGADLLCLPEMVTTGFDWERNRELLASAAEHHEQVATIARENKLAICGSFLEGAAPDKPSNTLLYFDASGELLARYRKVHLFTVFREDEHVKPGEDIVVADIGHTVAGFGVCYDLRFPELFLKNTVLGAKLQILPSAFPHPRLEHWRTLVKARAIENQCFFIAVNQVGVEGHGSTVGSTHYFGHSMVVDPWGEVLAEAGEEAELILVDFDLSRVDETRNKLPSLRDRRPELY